MKFWHTLEHGWTLKTLCWVTYWIRSDQISHSVMSDWIVKWKSLSCVWLLATPWTVAHQAPLSMEILQARILEWVAISFSRGSSWLRDRTQVLHCRQILYCLNYQGSPILMYTSANKWDLEQATTGGCISCEKLQGVPFTFVINIDLSFLTIF